VNNYLPNAENMIIHSVSDREPSSSVSIVSDYGLDDWAIDVWSSAEAVDFSSGLCAQTSSGAHPASYPTGTIGPFPEGKVQLGCDTDHSPPYGAEVNSE
jgi:hypothetical protein